MDVCSGVLYLFIFYIFTMVYDGFRIEDAIHVYNFSLIVICLLAKCLMISLWYRFFVISDSMLRTVNEFILSSFIRWSQIVLNSLELIQKDRSAEKFEAGEPCTYKVPFSMQCQFTGDALPQSTKLFFIIKTLSSKIAFEKTQFCFLNFWHGFEN